MPELTMVINNKSCKLVMYLFIFIQSMNDILNTHGTLISHNIRDSNCCVPDCYNSAGFNKTMNSSEDSNSIFLYTPPSNVIFILRYFVVNI